MIGRAIIGDTGVQPAWQQNHRRSYRSGYDDSASRGIVKLSCRGEKDTGQVGNGQRLRGESGRIRHCSGCRFQAWWGAIVQ